MALEFYLESKPEHFQAKVSWQAQDIRSLKYSIVPQLQLVQSLYKLGFRLISHETTLVTVAGPDKKDGSYHLVHVVFMKEVL